MTTRPDPPAVTRRAQRLTRERQVAYWMVLSGPAARALLAGWVPPEVRRQVLQLVKRGRAETADEYAARVAELT
jgi:hypothetical protein